jgi:phosphopantothenoylcysteine synthetase/decarboxylase
VARFRLASHDESVAANFDPEPGNLLFMIVSAGGPTTGTLDRLRQELDRDQRVRVIATPQAAEWLDHDEIERLTGWPLQWKMLTPEASTLVPMGNRVLATPVTLNTLTKWADGHADNLAIGLLCEALGAGTQIRAELSLSQQFANHPAVPVALRRLNAASHVTFDAHQKAGLSMSEIEWAAGSFAGP